MPQWTAFAAITGVVLVLLLVLSHLTQSAFSEGDVAVGTETDSDGGEDGDPETDPNADTQTNARTETNTDTADSADAAPTERDRPEDGSAADDREANAGVHAEPDAVDSARTRPPSDSDHSRADHPTATDPAAPPADAELDPADLSTGMLLANVAVSQGLFLFVILGAILYTGIPASALGIEFSREYLTTGLLLGTAAGVVLYVGNEFGAAVATRFGFDHDEQLRSMLAPDSAGGWLTLLLVVLPIIALFEELLFRAALIGVLSAGFDISPWLLAVLSSVAFALGHGMQGSVGIVVTGALGFVLAAVFIATGSFLVVVVAHYLINAFEFVVHEALELEWAESLESSPSSSSGSEK